MVTSDISLNPLLIHLPAFELVKQKELESELHEKGMEIFDFTLGDPKEPTPAFIRESLIKNIDSISQYPTTIGMLELRTAAAKWLSRRFNLSLNPKTQIIASNGSKEGIFHIPQVLFNQNTARNIVVFGEPGYPVYKSGTILAGGDPCSIPLQESKGYVLDINDIPKEKIPKIAALWMSYPHNPTGAEITGEAARKTYEWALENEIVLLSDECYVDMYFKCQKRPLSFLQIAQKENYKNLLCFFSLSKRSGMTGYRSGFIAGDEKLISLFVKYRLNVGVGTPDFVQHAAISAWNDDLHVEQRNGIFFEKRQLVESFLTKNKIEFLKTNATFYIWVSIPNNFENARKFCETLARKVGIFATPGEVFGMHCKKYFRLALVPTVFELKKCLALWQESLNSGNFS